MEIDAFLADSAEALQGKIYALGAGWSAIYATAFPVTHPRVAVGVIIRVPYTATNQEHRVNLKLVDFDSNSIPLGLQVGPDGQPTPVHGIGAQFNVGRPPLLPAGDEQVVALAMTIDGLQIPKPDMYTWVIEVDGDPMKRLPMRVQLLNQIGPNFGQQQ